MKEYRKSRIGDDGETNIQKHKSVSAGTSTVPSTKQLHDSSWKQSETNIQKHKSVSAGTSTVPSTKHLHDLSWKQSDANDESLQDLVKRVKEKDKDRTGDTGHNSVRDNDRGSAPTVRW
jgi:hypothetical protein